MKSIFQKIALKNRWNLQQIIPLQGGDINEVFQLICEGENYVIKINDAKRFPKMFETEAMGLGLLKNSQSFKIPNVKAFGTEEDISYLLLQHLPKGTPTQYFWAHFSQNLVQLHKTTNDCFGLDYHNYIGSLPQFNNTETTASEFYVNQRLQPQFKMARDQGFQFSSLEMFFKNISDEIPTEAPSLIHGDLWSGNYLVSEKGEPILIDPAVAFAPREMDLAMMQLFGGFPQEVYTLYNDLFPLENNWQDRISLWQLYYLLVHLNLFGSEYLSQVKNIINQYS